MKFPSEIELIAVLKRTLKQIFPRNNIELFEEVALGYGIADIVICSVDYPKIAENQTDIYLSRSDINIYKIISGGSNITFDTIYDTTRSSRQSISDSLIKLISLEYIKQVDNYFTIKKKYELPYRNSFAIEAKLKDWKRALNQAQRYKWFAEFSYVVLDEHFSQPAIRNIETFKKYNIGLATINTQGDFNRIYNPKRQRPYDPIMQVLLSEKIKSYSMLRNDFQTFK
jgi:hypothetical protein